MPGPTCRPCLQTQTSSRKRSAVLLYEVPPRHYEQAQFRHRNRSLRPYTPDGTPSRGPLPPSPHTAPNSAHRRRELLPKWRGTPDSARRRQDRSPSLRDTPDSAQPRRGQLPPHRADSHLDSGQRKRASSQCVTPPCETATSLCADAQRLTRNTALPHAMKWVPHDDNTCFWDFCVASLTEHNVCVLSKALPVLQMLQVSQHCVPAAVICH